MPFGDYSEKRCRNPKCGATFKPTTPWQDHCQNACRMHCTYLRTTILKRVRMGEARLARLRKKGMDLDRIRRMEERIAANLKKNKEFLVR